LIYFPYLLFRMVFTGKYRSSFFRRLGFFIDVGAIKKDDRVIWLHAVSVGETLATVGFQKKLKEAFPGFKLLFTTTTETGYRIALEKCKSADAVVYFPLDFHFSLRRFLSRFDIRLLVLTETEVWPNLIGALKKKGVPVAIINGRISDRSFKNYLRFSGVLSGTFAAIDKCLMQSEIDAGRIKSIGATPENVAVTGNLKYDEIAPYMQMNASEIYNAFGFKHDDMIFVAGSVHPGEDKTVIDAYLKVRSKHAALKMIIAPRKFDKIDGLYRYLDELNIKYEKRSEIIKMKRSPSENVMVLDTVGELVKTYAMAKIVFVGGSLVDVGGHNILEAAVFKKPVIFGPRMHNFREMSESFVGSGAGFMVSDGSQLAETMQKLIEIDEKAYLNLSSRAYSEVTRMAGATSRNIFILQTLLNSDNINSDFI